MSNTKRDAFEDFARRDIEGRGVDPDTAARVVEDTYREERPPHCTPEDVGRVVRPNHKGEDERGQVLDWTVYRGRLVDTWESPGRASRPVGRVLWFKDARQVFGPYTNGYPLSDLAPAD